MSTYVRDPKLWTSRRPPSAGPLDTTDDDNKALPPRPLPNSYWATPTLLASELPGDSRENVAIPRLRALLEVGITDFFDLTEEWESLPYFPILERLVSENGGQITKLDPVTGNYSNFFQNTTSNGEEGLLVRYARFPIRDGSVPSTDVLHSILDALYMVQQQHSRRAVVHCWGGIGRTGTIVGCWLVYSGAVSDEEEAPVIGRLSGATNVPVPDNNVPVPDNTNAEGGAEPPYPTGTARARPAGEVALGVLEKKWKGVDKSWRALRTPENALQEDMVRSFKLKRMTPSLQ